MAESDSTSAGWAAALSRRPAVIVAAVFIGGVALHDVLPQRALGWMVAAVCASAMAIFLRRRRGASIAVAFAIACAAVSAAQLEAFYFPANDIAAFASDQPRLCNVELDLDEPLKTLATAMANGHPLPPKQMTTASVVRLLTKTGWIDATGALNVQIDPPNNQLAMGQRIRALGMLQRPAPAMNPGQFDWAAYYRQQRILASIAIPHSDAIQIVSAHPPSLLAKLRETVRRWLGAGFTQAQSLDRSLLQALVLGDHDPEIRDVQEEFRRTGTSHHLAISGMHVAVLGYVVYLVCRLLRLRPRATVIAGMSFVLFYGVVALPSPSVIRSVILCIAFGLGILSRRSTDALQMVALSALAMLIYAPLDLFNAGFQLGFGTVLGLVVLSKRIEPLLRDPDAEAALKGGGHPDPRLLRRQRIRRWIGAPLAFGVIAWLVSMPLIAYHFDQLNPWAVIASLVLSFPVFLALVGGFLKIILTAVLPLGAPAWAFVAAWPVWLMRRCVDWLAMIPGSDVPLPGKSIFLVVLYYAILLLAFLPIAERWTKLRRCLRFSPAFAVLLLIALPLTGGATGVGDGALRVTLLAVGAGQCAVVELPNGHAVLIDAGSATLGEPVRKCIAPFLRGHARTSIDEIWLSHGDYDHVSAAKELIDTYHVPRVVVSSEFEDHAADNATDEALLDTIRRREVVLKRVHVGDRALLEKDITLDVLWPPADSALSSNNSGLVLKLTYARRTILFPADIQQPAQSPLLLHPEQLRCDVLIAPHHGSSESTTAAFVAAADPLYILSSNDRTPTQKQRAFERLIGDRPLFRTDKCGAITITIEKSGGLSVAPFVPQPELEGR
jgi:competence protein ComEC